MNCHSPSDITSATRSCARVTVERDARQEKDNAPLAVSPMLVDEVVCVPMAMTPTFEWAPLSLSRRLSLTQDRCRFVVRLSSLPEAGDVDVDQLALVRREPAT